MRHDFPGNVRELRNILERALIMADGNTILPQHLYLDTMKSTAEVTATNPVEEIARLASLEKRYLGVGGGKLPGRPQSLGRAAGNQRTYPLSQTQKHSFL